ncbi:hypothetical protein EDM00_02460 [Ornithobacterium rhinotracheale]|uniref:hypothetical protein n=1 Tax=Ornithobacterium rhinotracheale TaxID=28251 RepID=UPI00129C2F25|nr:hypothetical protein [Ornithobacterium rhinotracheale]MRI62862.1 hypothetical protein [Ornithobacterium rhinotracheale]
MLGKIFNKQESRKFKYIPRFYDTKTQDLINRRIGDTRFAQGYVGKKKSREADALDESHIDFKSFRNKEKQSAYAVRINTFIIFAILMLFVFIMWLITSPSFSNFFAE